MSNNQTTQSTTFYGNKYFLQSGNYGFAFCKQESKYEKLEKEREKIEQKHDQDSNFWRVGSFLAIFVSVGLSTYEIFSLQLALGSIFGNGDTEQFPTWLLILLGVTFSSIGLLIGHALNAETDPVTGRKKLTTGWWLALMSAIGYVAIQYGLSVRAGQGVDTETQGAVQGQSLFIVFIATAEIVLGLLFFKKSISYLSSFKLKILIEIQKHRMNRSAKNCYRAWDYYIGYVNDFNYKNPYNTVVAKNETENIKRAKTYFIDSAAYSFL